ncbi:SpoIIE family protein phosphatase [Pseudonocardia sp. UM4_GMWB1]|uniref:SpoIIE family protein phosphatase n=1 Tax=Pseudonocardia sp. UM4_GMWB1 TaxID=2212989 RepID=UPI003FD5C6AE
MASTVAIATIDTGTGEMRYASAGHPPPLVAGPEGVRTLSEGRGVPLGISGRPPFPEAVDRMEPGETILLCSDGLFERRNEVIDDGLARLSAAFDELSAAQPRDMADTLLHRMSEGTVIPDDTVVVVARLMPPPLRIAIEADPKRLAPLRRAVAAWAAQCGMGPDAVSDLQLTVGEAATNSIEHAYLPEDTDGRAGVDLDLALTADGSVAVRVTDGGRWRPPPPDPGYRGRGIALIRELAGDVHIDPSDSGTTVRFLLPAIPVEVGTPGAGPPVEFVAGEPEPDRDRIDTPSGDGDDGTVRARLRAVPDAHGVRIGIVGDLDLGGVSAIRAPLMEHVDRGLPITLNLPGEAFVSSAGMALLSEVARRMRTNGAALTLVAPAGSQARRSLVLSGLDTVIGMSDDDGCLTRRPVRTRAGSSRGPDGGLKPCPPLCCHLRHESGSDPRTPVGYPSRRPLRPGLSPELSPPTTLARSSPGAPPCPRLPPRPRPAPPACASRTHDPSPRPPRTASRTCRS